MGIGGAFLFRAGKKRDLPRDVVARRQKCLAGTIFFAQESFLAAKKYTRAIQDGVSIATSCMLGFIFFARAAPEGTKNMRS